MIAQAVKVETVEIQPPEVPLSKKIGVFTIIVLPALGVLLAMWFTWRWRGGFFNWYFLVLFVVFYLFSALGVTAGLHRYLTHGSFQASPFFEHLLLIQAGSAVEGFHLHWVGNHRKHHRFSDTEDDLHSPLVSFWHAHFMWFFRVPDADLATYAHHLLNRPRVLFWNSMFPVLVGASFVVPTLIGGIIGYFDGDGFLWGHLQGFVWGALVRIFCVHHVTWSVNSACHLWGERPYKTPGKDQSRNNWVVGILALGEGWHNNHHARHRSVQHAPLFVDATLWYIKLAELLGLAWDLRYYSEKEWESLRLAA